MYSSRPGLLIGFHGCEEAVRDSIVSGRLPLKVSDNGHDWLGSGCYFWENNYERALDFAKNPPGKKKFKNPAVLGAVVDLQFCLDIIDTEYIRLVKESFEVLEMPFGRFRILDFCKNENIPIAFFMHIASYTTATQNNGTLAGTKITATATDVPGNEALLEVTL